VEFDHGAIDFLTKLDTAEAVITSKAVVKLDKLLKSYFLWHFIVDRFRTGLAAGPRFASLSFLILPSSSFLLWPLSRAYSNTTGCGGQGGAIPWCKY